MIRTLLRGLVALAPRSFRDRHGIEVMEVHDARTAELGSSLDRTLFGLRELCGLGWAVVRLRLGAGGGGVSDAMKGATTVGRGGASMIETTMQDVRFALRTLRRHPGFTATTVVVLALGIGANTAIFSAANAFLFRPLPFRNANRLVMLYETNPEFGWTHETAAPANVLDWREQVGDFADVAMYSEFVDQVAHVRDGEPELLGVVSVTGNFFSVLGARPELGRGFTWDETWEGRDHVVVLSHDFWVSHFGSDPDVVGRALQLDTTSMEIVGVAPVGFDFPNPDVDLWAPWGWDAANRRATWFRRAHWVRPIARLKPGVTPAQADAELQTVVKRLQSEYPETNEVMGAGLMPLRSFLVMDVHRTLLVLLGAVGLLLLLACTNVANLMLVRGRERAREVALRFAVGAGRGRVARQIVTEGLVLALVAGVLGLGLGWLGIRALATRQQVGIRGATTLVLDGRVVLFTLGAALVAGLLFSLVPALRTARGDVQEALKEGGRTGSAARRSLRAVGTLVAVEVALAVLLVAGAGLMVRSFWLLRHVDPGFQPRGVLAVRFSLPPARYASRDQVLGFQDELERRLAARPGIVGVGAVAQLPLNGTAWTGQFQAEGWPPERVGFEIVHRRADAGYFRALETPLLEGRLWNAADGPDGDKVILINRTFARKYFPNEDPVGRKITYDRVATPQSVWHTIIGVVGDQLQTSPAEPARAEVFESRKQDWNRSLWFVVRTRGEAESALPAVKSVLEEMDPLVPLGQVKTMPEVWRASMARESFLLILLGAFGALALVLAAVGVYGVTSQAARRRTQEIGIRMALGARASEVVRLMLREGMTVVALGLAAGLVAALLSTRALGAILYGVAPTDPTTLTAVVALLAAVALAACWIPARKATGVDPVRSLRSE